MIPHCPKCRAEMWQAGTPIYSSSSMMGGLQHAYTVKYACSCGTNVKFSYPTDIKWPPEAQRVETGHSMLCGCAECM